MKDFGIKMAEVTESTKIWMEKNLIEKARRDKMKEVMEEYDKTVYYPARKALTERCSKIGHSWHFHDINPVGYPIFFCNQCGSTEIRKDE
jgi:hypothetical protein